MEKNNLVKQFIPLTTEVLGRGYTKIVGIFTRFVVGSIIMIIPGVQALAEVKEQFEACMDLIKFLDKNLGGEIN